MLLEQLSRFLAGSEIRSDDSSERPVFVLCLLTPTENRPWSWLQSLTLSTKVKPPTLSLLAASGCLSA